MNQTIQFDRQNLLWRRLFRRQRAWLFGERRAGSRLRIFDAAVSGATGRNASRGAEEPEADFACHSDDEELFKRRQTKDKRGNSVADVYRRSKGDIIVVALENAPRPRK